jgi:hypothetical protein
MHMVAIRPGREFPIVRHFAPLAYAILLEFTQMRFETGYRLSRPALSVLCAHFVSPILNLRVIDFPSGKIAGNGLVVVETLVSSKAHRKSRPVVFVGYVAGEAGHAGAAAATGLRTIPRPVGVILAHPARAVATRTFRPLARRLGSHLAGHALSQADQTRLRANAVAMAVTSSRLPCGSRRDWALRR